MDNKRNFLRGLRDGLPIGLGYFAVAFSLGIVARNSGMTVIQGFVSSYITHTSSGEYVVYALLGVGTTILEVIVLTTIANARYLLMSCALGQRLAPETSMAHRLLLGFGVTDEIFGITIAQEGKVPPFYTYGAMFIAFPMWASGTALGIETGNLMPDRAVSALSVALFGMFLAVIVPPARKNRIVAVAILISFAASCIMNYCSVFDGLSSGTKTIILTIIISSAVAILFPVDPEEEDGNEQ